MTLNFVIGFFIPWILGLFIFFKYRTLLLSAAPIGSIASFVVNSWGYYNNYWKVYPFELSNFSSVPFELGFFPILTVCSILLIQFHRSHIYLVLVFLSGVTTILEWLGMLIGRIVYSNGWNIIFTYISYLATSILSYWFYLKFRKIRVIAYFNKLKKLIKSSKCGLRFIYITLILRFLSLRSVLYGVI